MTLKTQISRWVLILFGLISIPLVYNSCQDMLNPGGVFNSIGSSSTSCKIAMVRGQPVDLATASQLAPSPFSQAKVRLSGIGPSKARSTSAGPLSVSAGSKLAVVLDNKCVQEHQQAMSSTVISKAITGQGAMNPEMSQQAYAWATDRDYTEVELEAQAQQEPCVVGLSWNQEYKIQTVSFNDPSYFVQDHLSAVHAGDAYNLFYGVPGAMNETSGAPVVFATVDTGVDYTHPDLKNSMWTGLGIDVPSLDTGTPIYNPMDVSGIGHGTHVSGMMAATSDNGIGIVGGMPFRGKIMGVKIFTSDSAGNLSTTSQWFFNGVQWAYQHGANVINLSVGSITAGTNSDPLALSALQNAVQAGATVVVVIGNADNGANGQLVDGVTLSSIPGEYATIDGVIGVGSFDVQTGQKSYFSHYSTTYAEIGAPGAEQGSTGIFSTVPVSLSSYGRLAGTSQAAPMVSAAAGLTIGLIREAYGIIPAPKEVERLIEASAVKDPNLAPYFMNGNRIDYLQLVQLINQDYPRTAGGQSINLCP